jgi:hypothetical protein
MNAPVPTPIKLDDTLSNHALADRLRRVVEGEVRFDHGTRARYATDASRLRCARK